MGVKPAIEAPESFPSTKPAFRLTSHFKDKHPCGDIYTGSTLIAVPLLPGGVLETVGDFEPRCRFTVVSSTDYFAVDADKTHGRMDAQAILVDDQGRAVRIRIDGVTAINEHTLPVIQGDADATSTAFGHAVEFIQFETGHDVYKPLERMRFAASQRFVVLEDGHTGVEIRAAQVIAGSGTV